MVIGQYENHNDTLGYQIAILWVSRILLTWTDREERMAKFRGIVSSHTWVITAIAAVVGIELWNQCVFCQDHWTFLSSRDSPAIESEQATVNSDRRNKGMVDCCTTPSWDCVLSIKIRKKPRIICKKKKVSVDQITCQETKKWGLIFSQNLKTLT